MLLMRYFALWLINFLFNFRLVGCENAIGIMTKLQTSLANEETWVDGATEKLTALPTATSALELDVSKQFEKNIFFSFSFIFLCIIFHTKSSLSLATQFETFKIVSLFCIPCST